MMKKTLIRIIFAAWVVAGLSACAIGGKPAVMVQYYALEYAPPSMQGLDPTERIIGIERFSVAQIFNHVKMIYRQQPGLYNEYAYHRWRANPGDMVGDCLLRDLRAVGIFKSVFSYRDLENPALLIRGGIGEFYESDETDGRKAILSVDLTLIDTTQRELPHQIIFQKTYRYDEPLTENTVLGFAAGMSRATDKFSRQVIRDIHEAIKDR